MKTMKPKSLFIILTLIVSFIYAGIYKIFVGANPGTITFTLFAVVYMFIPTIIVLLIKKRKKEPLLSHLFFTFRLNKWYLVAWLVMPVIAFATMGVNLLFPDVIFSSDMSGFFENLSQILPANELDKVQNDLQKLPIDIYWIIVIQGLIAGATINAIAGLGEEIGWRGYLLNACKAMKFYEASLFIGFIWGIWHAPVILMGHNYPQHPEWGVLMMTVWCILLTPLFIYITIKSKSVIAAAVMHGTLNATASLAVLKLNGGNDLINGVTGLSGFITLLIFNLGLYLYDVYISKEKVLASEIEKWIIEH